MLRQKALCLSTVFPITTHRIVPLFCIEASERVPKNDKDTQTAPLRGAVVQVVAHNKYLSIIQAQAVARSCLVMIAQMSLISC